MKARADLRTAAPTVRKVYDAMLGVEKALAAGGLKPALLNLVRLRASQINGCAYCLDMHAKDLRAAGETEQRIYGLDAWRETPYFNEQERAALALTEAVTLVSEGHVPDEVYEEARGQFSEEELELLTAAIAAINFWNRLSITLRTVPGEYQPPRQKQLAAETAELAHG